MRTVSLELAKKLKEAGLQHQITYGDWYLAWLPTEEIYLQKPVLYDYTACGPYEEDIWLPTLADLLEWLEGQGWRYKLSLHYNNKYCIQLCASNILSYWMWGDGFYADICEDAAAKAVLWVLEQEETSRD